MNRIPRSTRHTRSPAGRSRRRSALAYRSAERVEAAGDTTPVELDEDAGRTRPLPEATAGGLAILAPAPGDTLSGVVAVRLRADGQVRNILAAWLDGHMVGEPARSGSTPGEMAWEFDTGLLENGPRPLHGHAHPGALFDPVGRVVANTPITANAWVRVENGRRVHSVRPRFGILYLVPGESASLDPYTWHTDASRGPATDGWTAASSDSAVVSLSGNTLTAHRPGAAAIALSAPGLEGSLCRVLVRSAVEFRPLFPGIIARSLFSMGEQEFAADPTLRAHWEAAKVNVIEQGILNPRGAPEAAWDAHMEEMAERIRALGFRWVAPLDDLYRGPGERATTLGSPWFEAALARLQERASDVLLGLLAPDEGGIGLHEGGFPNAEAARVRSQVGGRLPLSWPVMARWDPEGAAAFGSPPWSDFACHYFAVEEIGPAWHFAARQLRAALDHTFWSRAPFLDSLQPLAFQVIAAAGAWHKRHSGDGLDRARDLCVNTGALPEHVGPCALHALGLGASYLRAYSGLHAGLQADWDRPPEDPWWQVNQAAEWNAHPARGDTDLWAALAALFRLVSETEALWLLPRVSAPDLGPNLACFRMQGPHREVLLAINWAEGDALVRPEGWITLPADRWLHSVTTTAKARVTSAGPLRLNRGEAVLWAWER